MREREREREAHVFSKRNVPPWGLLIIRKEKKKKLTRSVPSELVNVNYLLIERFLMR